MLQTLAWLNTRRLLVAILFICIFAMAVRAPVDSDLWWHLAAGDWMLQNGTVPRVDPFSHTVAGQPWIEQGWLPDLITAFAFRHGGYAALGLLLAVVVTSTLAITYTQSRANRFARAFALLLAAVTSAVYWSMRPQIFSFLLFAVVLWILDRHKHGHVRVVWLLLPLMLLWANCHGAWISGYILIAVYIVGEALNRFFRSAVVGQGAWGPLLLLSGVAVLSVPLITLNPNGLTMLTYPFKTVGIGVLQEFIEEWAAPNFHQLHVQPFIWLLLLTFAAIGLAGRRIDFTHLLTLAGFCYLAMMAGRNIALFALVAYPILADYGEASAAGLWESLRERYPRLQSFRQSQVTRPARLRPAFLVLNWLLVVFLLVATVAKALQPLSLDFNEKTQSELYPAGAIAYLRTHELPGEMFNSYNWGGYLIWTLYPERRVFIDGRTDLYDDAFVRQYLDITLAQPGWEDTLARYDVGYAVIERASLLIPVLTLHPAWESVYQDEVASVYVRR